MSAATIRAIPQPPSRERFVIGVLLQDPARLFAAVDLVGLEPSDLPTLGPILDAALALRKVGLAVDLSAIISQLGDKVLTDLGGSAVVSSYADDLPDVGSSLRFVCEAREPGLRRRLAAALQGVLRGDTSADDEATHVLVELRRLRDLRSADAWPERRPLPVDDPLPELPPGLLPLSLQPWIVDVANRANLPLEAVAAPAIVGLSTVVGRTVGIRPERVDDWLVVPNLWGGLVLPPGMLKTHAISEALRPLYALEARARERHEAEKIGAEARKVALQTRLASAKKSSRGETVDESEIEALLRELQDCNAVTEQRYRTSDVTVEKLGELLRENPRGVLLSRDELAGFLKTLEKPERSGEREFFLEAWNGTGSFTFDRIGRGTVHIPSVSLSVFGGIQPGKLKAYVNEALGDGAGADGLLQRLQLTVWPDGMKPYKRPSRLPDTEAKRRALAVFEALERLTPEEIGAEQDLLAGPQSVPFLRFGDDAQAHFDTWREGLEARLRTAELQQTPAFCSHLAKYRSLMPALALLFDLAERVDGGRPMCGGVSVKATARAGAWCEFLELHARKLYRAELRADTTAAQLLAAKIEAGEVVNGMLVRDLYRRGWSGLRQPERVWEGLRALERLGWLKVDERHTGGRPMDVVRLHPDFRGGKR